MVADAVLRNQSLGLSLPGNREEKQGGASKSAGLALWLTEKAADCKDMLAPPFQN
jgi:hypothetical protein